MSSRSLVFVVAISLAAHTTHAATLLWTNTSGGDWNVAANWSPNQVPAVGDTTQITTAGTYAVTNNQNTTISSLTIGGAAGAQGLVVPAGATLRFTSSAAVNGNGHVIIQNGGALNAAAGLSLSGPLTNSGTINLTNHTLQVYNNNTATYRGGLVNLAGGTMNLWGNGGVSGTYGQDYFLNQGQIVRRMGTGTSTIGLSRFDSAEGTVQVQAGTLNVGAFVGTLAGTFNAVAGTTIQFT